MAAYKFASKWGTGSYADVTITPDPSTTVFKIGDIVTVSGTVYNAESSAVTGIYTGLNHLIEPEIAVNIAKGKTKSFTQSIEISRNHVSSNAIVGQDVKAKFSINLVHKSVSEIDELSSILSENGTYYYTLYFKIDDDTVAPVYSIDDVQFADSNGYLDYFDQYVQNKSICNVYLPPDKITTNPDGQISGRLSYVALDVQNEAGEKVYTAKKYSTSRLFDVGEIFSTPGNYTFTITVRGEYGKSNIQSRAMTVLPYTKPDLSAIGSDPVVLRYKKGVDDYGETIYTPDMTGTLALFKFDGGIAHLNGKNTWSLSLDYDLANADVAAASSGGVIASGTEINSIGYDYLDTLGFIPAEPLPVEFSPANRYRFTFTLTDYFGETAVLTGYADKATGLFNVTKNGVAVGMITTGEPGKKKFEVNENYESLFYGGIHGVTNYADGEIKTGGRWIDNRPIYRKILYIGNIAANGTGSAPIGGGALGALVSLRAWGIRGGSIRILPFAHSDERAAAWLYVDGWESDDPKVSVGVGSSGGVNDVTAIIEYTKASDEPVTPDDGTAPLMDADGIAVADAGGTPYTVRAYNADQYISVYTGAQIDTGIAKAYDALPILGGSVTGMLTLFADPIGAMDAVTKQFLEAAIRQIELTPGPRGVGIVDVTIEEVTGEYAVFTDKNGNQIVDANNNSFMVEV